MWYISPAQKIYNIDGNKFFVCYNKQDGYTYSLYCILGEHVSEGSIIKKSKSSFKLLDNCELKYYSFFIGFISISSNYIIVCTRSESIYYTIFDINFEISYTENHSFPNSSYYYNSLTLPYVFTYSDTYIIFNYKHIFISYDYTNYYCTKSMFLDSPKCKNITKSGSYSMNKNINIKLSDGVDSFTSATNYQKIKIVKLPIIGISEFNTSINYSINSNPFLNLIFQLEVNIHFHFI